MVVENQLCCHTLHPVNTTPVVRSVRVCLCLRSLYILDLLPLVYRYLPRDSSNGAPAPTAAAPPSAPPQPGQAGQQEAVVADPAEGVLASLLALTKRNVATPTHMAVAVDVPGATYRCVHG